MKPFHQFIREQATTAGVTPKHVAQWVRDGKFRALKLHRVHYRKQFVERECDPVHKAREGEVTQKQFVAEVMAEHGKDEKTIYRWMKDGRFPGATFRRVNARTIFVSGDFTATRPPARFEGVDWTRKDTALAKDLGCHRTNIYWHRKKRGLPAGVND